LGGGKSVRIEGAPKESYDLAQSTADRYCPDRVWVCDICQTRLKYYYVLEIGCFSCAGLYAADMDIVAKEVSNAAYNEYKEIMEI